MKQISEPLYSRELALNIERKLEEANEQCALLFRFMLETGTPLNASLKLKVHQMDDFKSIHVQPILSNGKDYYAKLSEEFSKRLQLSCQGKGSDEFVFSISRSTFTKLLNTAVLSVAPDKSSRITPTSVSKTYFLRFYEYTLDIHDVMKYTGHTCPSRAYLYIGLPPNGKESAAFSRIHLLSNQNGKKLISSITSSLEEISSDLENPIHTDQYYDKLFTNLKKIEEILNSINF